MYHLLVDWKIKEFVIMKLCPITCSWYTLQYCENIHLL